MKLSLLVVLSFVSHLTLAQYRTQLVLQQQHFYINSVSNVGGKNQVTLPIQLPANTVAWYYTLSAHRDQASLDAVSGQMSLMAKLVAPIAGIPPGSTELVYQAVRALSGPPSGNYCDVYLLDRAGFDAFTSKSYGRRWAYHPTASRENFISGYVPVCDTDLQQGELYLGIRNPDKLHGIHVLVSVEAVVGPLPSRTTSLLTSASSTAPMASSAFVGRWKDENSTFSLKADGSMTLQFDTKRSSETGNWFLQGDRLYMNVGAESVAYRVLSTTPNRFVYQALKAGTVFTAQRFAE